MPRLICLTSLLFALSGCMDPVSDPVVTPSPPVVGGDRDAHGCIGSAGYQWCAREQACVRSWELAEQKSLERSPEAFNRYCGQAAP